MSKFSTLMVVVLCTALITPVLCINDAHAESLSPIPVQPMVEVTYSNPVSFNYEESSIIAPRLPRRAWKLEGVEHQYYERLYGIASQMCETDFNTVVTESKGSLNNYAGFATQLTQYNTIRQLLNSLLSRYRLGFAPGIEDFTHVHVLELFEYEEQTVVRHHHISVKFIGEWTGMSAEGTNNCSFAIINPEHMK